MALALGKGDERISLAVTATWHLRKGQAPTLDKAVRSIIIAFTEH